MTTTKGPRRSGWIWLGIAGFAAIVMFGIRDRWLPTAQLWVRGTIAGERDHGLHEAHSDHGSDGHDSHAEGGHENETSTSLLLSKQAQGNIGLTSEFLRPVSLQTFRKTITVPGIIVDRPGRTRVEISTPMAGVITHVHAVQGEAVRPGTLLFELRITAEELVSTQTDLLKTVGELDVENREILRLTKVSESGAVSQKTLLERQYAKEKLEVLMNAQREALRLHGLSERQIDDITSNRRLLRDLQIVAPMPDTHGAEELKLSEGPDQPVASIRISERLRKVQERNALTWFRPGDSSGENLAARPLLARWNGHQDHSEHGHEESVSSDEPAPSSLTPLILQEVLVHKGETVRAGATLGVLADYSELYIEGRALEQDVELVSACSERGWKVAASFDIAGQEALMKEGLDLIYSASEIDPESRSLSFFVRLPNTIARETPSPNGQHFLDWQYRPGRRLQLLVPVEEWVEQIVLPVEAIAREGAESFVFQQNGAHFDRVPVHVKYRDAAQVVVANDGSIFPGDIIALRGAHQMQMALKNNAGGGADPHAGHNH